MNYENKILDAIETVVNNAVSNAGYDRTIQAKIISCIDPTIGKYKVQYQDSTFFAYSGSSEIIYTDGSEVYILVPGNDMSRDKTILGTTKKLGANYSPTPEGDEAYEIIGNNCIDTKDTYELCSYKPNVVMLYNKDSSDNLIRLNLTSIETYIRQSSSIICGGTMKTSLPAEQQFKGNYGIVFELTFLDNASQNLVTRNYIVDVNQIQGNPYKIPNYRRQYGIFDIDAINFQYVSKIYLFVYNFPNTADDKPADIFIKNIEFCGGVASSQDELSSCGLVFITPQGTYFDDNDLPSATRKLQAQVRVKGKNIDNDSQKLSFYWFVENVGVTLNSQKYCAYGGQGWQCLNDFNLVQASDGSGNSVVEWVPETYERLVKKSDSAARETKYKCVVLYNDIKLSKEIIITNYSSTFDITIESDSGTQFYFDIGHPTLTCLINGQEKNEDNFTYVWSQVDNNNNFTSLEETTEENDEYNNAVAKYNELLDAIKNEQAMVNASTLQLNEYLTTIKKYDIITRVEKNKLFKVLISSITNFCTYKCSVYNNGVFLGTGSIILYNGLETEDIYSLIINNGTQVFKYNEAGVAPTAGSLDNPMTLNPLTFTVYDNLGNEISNDVIKNSKIKWIIPTVDTMISIPRTQGDPTSVDLINNTETYENTLALNYTISARYNVNNKNNTIKLILEYKDMTLVAKTDFTFAKEGDPGTNGTEFLCKIVPNIGTGESPIYPMILNGKLNFTPQNKNKWFKVQLWHSGNKIFEGTTTGITTENKNAIVLWSNLLNKYSITISDNTDINITDAQNGIFEYGGYTTDSVPANIIKCSVIYDGITYYATMPIITAETYADYKVELKPNTGFLYATYSSDGRSPIYDNTHPFELTVTKNINGIEEDISTLTQDNVVTYEWSPQGKIYDPVKKEWDKNNIHLGKAIILQEDIKRNQAAYKPLDNFNGECLTNALECTLKNKDDEVFGHIHIPIHLLLNKYGNAAINEWDGNHVSIDENGSGIILAPQVGAGKKEEDNSYTGMLMGQVKEAGKSNMETGMFGYSHGARTMFLNADDGSAIFGKAGNGQIIIDPSQDKAFLYSSNYWNKYDVYGKPSSYSDSNKKGEGMLIDLTTPKILWGNGNFYINELGYIYAKGGGQIAGWNIDDYKLYKEKTGMSSVDDVTEEGVTKYDVKIPYATQDETGYATDSKAVAFWAGKNKFFVTHNGYLKANEASIGSGTNPIFIGKSTGDGRYSAIWSGKKSQFGANANGFYIGTDGISLGSLNSNGESKFQVTNGGDLTARQGHIGGWNISRNTITAGNVTLNSNGNLSGQNWYINNDGSTKFGNLTISATGDVTANNMTANGGKFNNVIVSGEITATSGTFANCTITNSCNIQCAIPGRLVTSGVNASNVTTGSMSADRISGGTLNIATAGGGYVKAGVGTTHLDTSGINITGGAGINFNGQKGINLDNGTTWNFSGGDGNFGTGTITCGGVKASNNITTKELTIKGAITSGGKTGLDGHITFASLTNTKYYLSFHYGIATGWGQTNPYGEQIGRYDA